MRVTVRAVTVTVRHGADTPWQAVTRRGIPARRPPPPPATLPPPL